VTSTPFRLRLAQALAGPRYHLQLAAVTSRVDDGPGWRPLSYRPHERDGSEIEELYNDALTAWRKNPLAKRAVDITADYVIGDGITLASPFEPLAAFADSFWHHPRNRVPNRLETMCHELTLAGDLFPVLFRNPHDGMSYLRFSTKDRIAHISTMPQDWETEIAYEELPRSPGERPRTLLAATMGQSRITRLKFTALSKAALGSRFISIVETGRFRYWADEDELPLSDAW
jgi:hypothetical protein